MMRPIAANALTALALASLLAAGCATRTQAPVSERATPPPRTPTIGIVQSESARSATYVVKRGDTLYSIAAANGMDHRQLAALNHINDPSELRVGQVLVLTPQSGGGAAETGGGSVAVNPITATAPVEARPLGATGAPPPQSTASAPVYGAPAAAGATAAGTAAAAASGSATPGLVTAPKAAKLPYSEQNLARLRRGEEARPAQTAPAAETPPASAPPAASAPGASAEMQKLPEGNPQWAWPAAGKIVSTFQQTGGKGVAIGGKLGDPIYASAAGTVVYSGEGLPNYGKLIIVKHNDEYLSVYAHNSTILVKEKQSVAKGQKIAEMGTSGTGAPSPRLHFEIRRLGKTVDPQQLLPGRQ